MEKDNLFFTYLEKLNRNKKELKKDEKNGEVSVDNFDKNNLVENEWLQEYELIYQSYSIV
jgi:hypothetical protein